MCSNNRVGPKTAPCGTPESTVTRSDCIPSTTTCCFTNALEKSKTAMSI